MPFHGAATDNAAFLKGNSSFDPILQEKIKFHRRQSLLHQFCYSNLKRTEMNAADLRITFSEHFYYPEANVYFCSLPKTGTTTLDSFFQKRFFKNSTTKRKRSIFYEENQMHKLHRFNFSKFQSVNSLEIIKFLVARDPLDRIFSCWYNKFSGLIDPRSGRNITDVQVCCYAFTSSHLFYVKKNVNLLKIGQLGELY